VRIGAPLVKVTRSTVSGVLGSNNVTLECFIDSFPKSTNFWLKGELERLNEKESIEKYKITEDNLRHVQFRDRLRLQILNLSVEDLGKNFRCISTNEYGTDTGLIQVTAHSFLKTKPEPANGLLEARLGARVILHCEVKGFPLAVTYWFRNRTGEQLMWSDDYHVTEQKISPLHYVSSLHIRAVSKSDFTLFTCISKNSFGASQNSFRILEKRISSAGWTPFSAAEKISASWIWLLLIYSSVIFI